MREAAGSSTVEKYARHINPAFVKLLGVLGYGRVYVRAKDTRLWDAEGREYLDFLAGFGSFNLGHGHPRLQRRMHAFLDEDVPNLLHVGPSPAMADLGEALAGLAGEPLRMTLFSTSGAEAVEAGLKLARAATRRPGIVYCHGGYHGLGLGTLSVMGEARMRAPFEPLLADCRAVPFGDSAALERALGVGRVGAFVVEPIQSEGGVIEAPPGYLAEAQRLCRKAGALLVLDEVQTGLGRTGKMFAFQAEGMTPDVLVLGKALGGGLAAISATLASPALLEKAYGSMDRFDLHGSTFAGNALACAAAGETLRIVSDEKLAEQAAARGRRLVDGLKARLATHPLVRNVRGRGLLVGIELGPAQGGGLLHRMAASLVKPIAKNVFGQWLALRLLERGILCQPAALRWDVLKLEPPLTVTDEEIDRVVDQVGSVLDDYRDLAPLFKDVTARLGHQFLSGWKF